MKKIISAVLCLAISCALMVPTFAATPEGIDPQYMPAEYIWTIVSQQELYEYSAPHSEWQKAGFMHAKKAGERLVATPIKHKSVATVFEGTLSVAKGLIEARLNLSFTIPVEQSNTAMISAPLKADQCVQAYHVPRYAVYQVTQQKIKIDQAGKSTPVGDEVVCMIAKPAIPTVEFEYFYE